MTTGQRIHLSFTAILLLALLVLGGLLLVGVARLSFGQPPKPDAEAPGLAGQPAASASARPPLTRELVDWVSKGGGRLTRAEVVAKLGPPDEVALPDKTEKLNPDAELALAWREATFIEVELKGGKATRIEGRFSPNLPRRRVNRDNFNKPQLGMSKADVTELLAGYNRNDGGNVYRWGGWRELRILFSKDLVYAHSYDFPAEEP
jgi:hypothetical protein